MIRPAIGAGLPERIAPHRDARKTREPRIELAPDPEAQVLQAGIFEPGDFVQQRVIETAVNSFAR